MRSLLLAPCLLLLACPGPTAPPVTPIALDVAGDGTVSITRGGEGVSSLRASVRVDGVDVQLAAATPTTKDVTDALGAAQETVLSATSNGVVLTLTLHRYERFVTARLAARCDGACGTQRVEGFTLAGALAAATSATATLVNGYSSWAPSYWAALQRDAPDEVAAFTGANENAFSSDARVSWWVSALATKGPGLALGAVTADAWKTRVLTWRADGVVVRVESGFGGDSLPLTAAGVESETLLVTVDDSTTAALRTWADAVATLQPPPAAPFVPVGWNSWNTLFDGVTHDNALANADALKALGYGANNVQLDDGWEQAWGDWNANAKFPQGMDGFASALDAKGLHGGVWLAPFLVDETSPVATAHPEWLLTDAQGKRLTRHDFFTGATQLTLDASHPDARAWLVGELDRVMAQGYRYLKLDYLYAGAFEGTHARDVTSLMAFREAMQEVAAKAKARGAYVVACGAPVLPVAGVTHALRTSNDIAARGQPYTFEWVKNVSRNVVARWWVGPFLANDPDTILVRGLPAGVARQQVTTALLAGPLLGLGDDLTALTADEAALLAKTATLPALARLAQPGDGLEPLDAPEKPKGSALSQAEALLDAESYAVPSLWAARGTSEGTLVGVFNWTNSEASFTVDAAALGLTGGEGASELWQDLPVTFSDGAWHVTVPARDVAYLRMK